MAVPVNTLWWPMFKRIPYPQRLWGRMHPIRDKISKRSTSRPLKRDDAGWLYIAYPVLPEVASLQPVQRWSMHWLPLKMRDNQSTRFDVSLDPPSIRQFSQARGKAIESG